jgi:hypothetical protein
MLVFFNACNMVFVLIGLDLFTENYALDGVFSTGAAALRAENHREDGARWYSLPAQRDQEAAQEKEKGQLSVCDNLPNSKKNPFML